ncbi:glycosyltransferase [Halovenus sp. WSH3]|uniref:Glycosyltransferase n=1 Tax=Halovenus carboxidivorans TaxID=2692199 RepID=A0A6B0T4I5_9EURY|nr:glycosyltransferase [Halovenus carboxidivorans]MXR50423.1 glycosyltransferase [Halovenus carboxidivorans]
MTDNEHKVIDVAFLIGNLNKEHGGGQQLLYDICRQLPEDEFDLTVYFMFGDGTYRPLFEEEGVDVIDIDADSNYDLVAFHRLVHQLRRGNHEILHTNSPISGVWGRIAATIVDVPNIISVEHNMHQTYKFQARVANGLSLPLADHIVGVSNAVTESFLPWEAPLLKSTPKHTIVNGIDVEEIESHFGECRAVLQQYTDCSPEELIIGSVGRLTEQKGYEYLIKAFSEVRREHPTAKLILIGDGPKRDKLEQIAIDEQVRESTHFTGYVPEVYPFLPAFDVGVFPSLWEGLPLAPAECMTAKCPIIASDIPPFNELLSDAGVLVPTSKPEAISNEISRLLTDEERRKQLGKQAYQRVNEEFSIQRTVSEYAQLYREVTHE